MLRRIRSWAQHFAQGPRSLITAGALRVPGCSVHASSIPCRPASTRLDGGSSGSTSNAQFRLRKEPRTPILSGAIASTISFLAPGKPSAESSKNVLMMLVEPAGYEHDLAVNLERASTMIPRLVKSREIACILVFSISKYDEHVYTHVCVFE